MDINQLRIGITLLSLALFIGIVAWTVARSRRQAFDEAAQLPFQDGEPRHE